LSSQPETSFQKKKSKFLKKFHFLEKNSFSGKKIENKLKNNQVSKQPVNWT